MGTFSLAIRQFADRAGDNAEKVFHKVAIDMLRKVVLRSPVDTGRFRANWAVGTAPASYEVKGVDPSGQKAISEGSAAVVGIELGGSIWISNPLPYGPRLENGYSKQAPAGMVKVTVAEYQQLIDRAVQEVR